MSETVTRRDHAERVREYYRQQGAEREQARIIELLEKAQITNVKIIDSNFEPREIKVRCESVRADLLIDLIKGDN